MLYPTPTVIPVTTFRAPEGWITFYDQVAYKAAGFANRGNLAALGDYLFMTGFSLTEQQGEHPPLQSYGSGFKNLTARSYVSSSMGISALYTQEGRDLRWLDPASQSRMVAVVEFVAPDGRAQGDVLDPDGMLRETLVIYDVVYLGSKIFSPESGAVGYSLDFSAGRVDHAESRA